MFTEYENAMEMVLEWIELCCKLFHIEKFLEIVYYRDTFKIIHKKSFTV